MGAGREQVERAYRLFARPAPPDLGVCTACCMDPAVERAMLMKAPRDLTVEEVREWLAAAFSDGLGRAQVEWILPRILDLLAEGAEVATGGNEVALARLGRLGFPEGWSEAEAAAVRDLCLLALEHHIRSDTRAPLDDMLCMVAAGGLDLAPFLARLDALPDDVLARLLHDDWGGRRGLRIWRTPFWDGLPARQAVWGWYVAQEARMWGAAARGDRRAAEVAEAISEAGAAEPGA